MNAVEARATLSKISYRGWVPVLGHYTNGAFWFQWSWREDGREERGQRWYVSNTLSTSGLVEIAWLAVQAALVKEAQEHFRYRDAPIYSGYNVDLLSELHNQLCAKETDKEEKKDD
jgi:hypothetical protein